MDRGKVQKARGERLFQLRLVHLIASFIFGGSGFIQGGAERAHL